MTEESNKAALNVAQPLELGVGPGLRRHASGAVHMSEMGWYPSMCRFTVGERGHVQNLHAERGGYCASALSDGLADEDRSSSLCITLQSPEPQQAVRLARLALGGLALKNRPADPQPVVDIDRKHIDIGQDGPARVGGDPQRYPQTGKGAFGELQAGNAPLQLRSHLPGRLASLLSAH